MGQTKGAQHSGSNEDRRNGGVAISKHVVTRYDLDMDQESEVGMELDDKRVRPLSPCPPSHPLRALSWLIRRPPVLAVLCQLHQHPCDDRADLEQCLALGQPVQGREQHGAQRCALRVVLSPLFSVLSLSVTLFRSLSFSRS